MHMQKEAATRHTPGALQSSRVVPRVNNKQQAADARDAAFEHVHVHVETITQTQCGGNANTHHDGGLLT